MTSHRDLMLRHVAALFTHDAAGNLVHVNEPAGAPAPRFFIGRTAEGITARFRRDVAAEVRRELLLLARENGAAGTPLEPAPYAAILERSAPVVRIWSGPAFSFPDVLPESPDAVLVDRRNADVLRPLLHEWLPDVQSSQPMLALLVEGRAVAVCCSVRGTDDAHEAGVETAPAHRGRGHAAQVVRAWAEAVRRMGPVPLYSTSWQNTASRTVARKLGLICFGSDMHIT